MGEIPGQVKWLLEDANNSTDVRKNDPNKVAAPKYSAFGEKIRHVTPSGLTCSMFCGGKQCKYCNPAKFKEEEMSIKGLFSSWVTENILATSRPSTEMMKQFEIVKQFQSNGIKSIINLQLPNEHAACGFGLQPGGFSYTSQDFMDHNVFFYNFGWNDYGVRSLHSILDMVKVMDFAISNGKVAVHCHAGLGRTGVLIACYLVYSKRLTAHEAILKMRETRPKAIQTRGQINCVKDFATYVEPMWVVFSQDGKPSTLLHFMNRQRHLLHGEEGRTLKHIPKIVFTIFQKLLQLAEVDFDLSKCTKITYFGFMRNSSYNTLKKMKQNAGSNQTSEECIAEIKDKETKSSKKILDIETTHQKVQSDKELPPLKDTQVDTQSSLSFSLKKYPSSMSICNTVNDDKTLDEQFKATSTPNVFFYTDNNDSQVQENPKNILLKKGKLKPIKSKKNRGKGLKERLTKLKRPDDVDENSLMNVSIDSAVLSNQSDTFSLNSSVDSRLEQRRKSDNISISSFSNSNELSAPELVLKHLAFRCSDVNVSNQVERYKHKLNMSDNGWKQLSEETNLAILAGVLWAWLSQLQGPIVSLKQIELMNSNLDSPEDCFQLLDKDIWKIMECILTCVSKLDDRQCVVERIIRRLSIIMTGDDSIPWNVASLLENTDECSPGVVFFHFSMAWLNLLNGS